jgi:hypothetical protein
MIFRNACNAASTLDLAGRSIKGVVHVVEGISPAELGAAIAGRALAFAKQVSSCSGWTRAS